MKYLYLIMRLFKCPHKYSKTLKSGPVTSHEIRGDVTIGHYYDKQCCKCGRIKSFRT